MGLRARGRGASGLEDAGLKCEKARVFSSGLLKKEGPGKDPFIKDFTASSIVPILHTKKRERGGGQSGVSNHVSKRRALYCPAEKEYHPSKSGKPRSWTGFTIL